MRSRIVWFVAGSATGIYTAAKARRAAYRLSTPGLVDQAAAAGLGWRAFSAELRDGMRAHEDDIVRRLTTDPHTSMLRLDEAPSDASTASSDKALPDKKAT